ncbi:hypothetical protein LBYZC6_03950 [Lacrimispora brassicae]
MVIYNKKDNEKCKKCTIKLKMWSIFYKKLLTWIESGDILKWYKIIYNIYGKMTH